MDKHRRDTAELTTMPSLKTSMHFASSSMWRDGYCQLIIWPLLLSCQAKEGSVSASKEPFKIPQVAGNILTEITSTVFQWLSSSGLFGKHGEIKKNSLSAFSYLLWKERKSRGWAGWSIFLRQSEFFIHKKLITSTLHCWLFLRFAFPIQMSNPHI